MVEPRNWDELLQELRVTQRGVQILSGFLLTLPFEQRFLMLPGYFWVIFLAAVGLSTPATGLIVAPVSAHRLLLRSHEKDVLVASSARVAKAGLADQGRRPTRDDNDVMLASRPAPLRRGSPETRQGDPMQRGIAKTFLRTRGTAAAVGAGALVAVMLATPAVAAAAPTYVSDPASYVNTLSGTGSGGGTVGSINNFPGPSVPFGMMQFSPDNPGTGQGYAYSNSTLRGFGLNHASQGCGAFGDIPLLPTPTNRGSPRTPTITGGRSVRRATTSCCRPTRTRPPSRRS